MVSTKTNTFDCHFLNSKFLGVETNKKVSSMNFYAYRMMIRQNIDNHLLRYRRLFQQYAVDMYVKVETERLNYIRFNQAKLRSEEYIHLRDAVNSDADITDVGRLTILPSTYIWQSETHARVLPGRDDLRTQLWTARFVCDVYL